jgi:hypothetical protein
MRLPTAGKSTFDLSRSLPLNLPSFSMLISMLTGAVFCPALILAQTSPPSQPAAKPLSKPLTLTVYDRTRVEAWQWFAATPNAEQYGYVESLVRLGLQQRVQRVDWQLELSQAAVLGLPSDAVSTVTAQGQLGLGGTYYASNSNNTEPVAASFKQGYLRYHFSRDANTVRLGRFEFFDGQETTPKNTTLAWLQANRIQQRLVGNFGFSNGQRSFDGADAHLTGDSWDLTGMAARADQGVYNMNANPELNVDLQYLAYTRYLASQRVQLRGFAMGYHDGRPNIVKTDNRTVAARTADHHNIRIGSYGMNAAAAVPAGKSTVDLLFWGVLQNGQWGLLNHHAGAVVAEGGIRGDAIPTQPWLRGGFLRSTGDQNPTDNQHNTFFQVLPTPRVYARFPFFNMMNSSDQFVQLVDKPTKKLDLRTDLHFLQLTNGHDLWYTGGGAGDTKVFGYQGRPGNAHTSFASFYDVSADYAVAKPLTLSAYYGLSAGRTVVHAIYPKTKDAQFGYFELVYRFNHPLTSNPVQ